MIKKLFGYAFNAYYQKLHKREKAKIINVENKSYLDSDYPLLFNVYLIYRKDNINENIEKMIEWLKTEEGKQFINEIK